jgi:hypothetical protein
MAVSCAKRTARQTWFCRHSEPSGRNRTDLRCRSMRRRPKWASGLLIFLLSVPLFGAALIFVAMSAGIYSIILNMKSRPGPDSPDLRRNRTKLEEQIGADFSRAIPSEGFVHYETSTEDTCYDGANTHMNIGFPEQSECFAEHLLTLHACASANRAPSSRVGWALFRRRRDCSKWIELMRIQLALRCQRPSVNLRGSDKSLNTSLRSRLIGFGQFLQEQPVDAGKHEAGHGGAPRGGEFSGFFGNGD